jgi:phage/plasmid-like protein (TIGR03299 family)
LSRYQGYGTLKAGLRTSAIPRASLGSVGEHVAHNLATINGRVSMAYQGSTPWHNLGTRMASTADVDQALTAANLDWTVRLDPMFLGDGREVPERRAVVRDGDRAILGTVGNQYTTIQNRAATDILRDACADFGVTIESAGALGNGARCFMLAKLPMSVQPVPGDIVAGYFLLGWGHDGGISHNGRPTPIRVVCQNTLTMAMSDGVDMIRIRHTASAAQRLGEAKRLIDGLIGAMKATGDTFTQLAERRMTPADVATYIERVFPSPDGADVSPVLKSRRNTVAALVWAGKGAELAGSDASGTTAWGAYNAVTEYFDHVRPAEAKSLAGTRSANESAIFGQNAVIKVQALKIARQLVAV